jgi:tripartite-type tricarboxylate transporter receptor subunit TctC
MHPGRLLIAFCFLSAAFPATAQDKHPNRPIKVVVPYAPGGAVDIVARIVTEQMRQTLGQNIVIENKPGAFGILAVASAWLRDEMAAWRKIIAEVKIEMPD